MKTFGRASAHARASSGTKHASTGGVAAAGGSEHAVAYARAARAPASAGAGGAIGAGGRDAHQAAIVRFVSVTLPSRETDTVSSRPADRPPPSSSSSSSLQTCPLAFVMPGSKPNFPTV